MDKEYFDSSAAKIKYTPFGIFVDQAGYTPERRKIAVMPFEAEDFTVCDENGDTVFSGKTAYFGYDEDSGDTVRTADFSELKAEGIYRVHAGGRTSALFRIGGDVYDKLLYDTSKAYYYLRCGCELEPKYAGAYHHKPCHCSAASLYEDGSITLDVAGGWHDAGDYGRYVTAGAVAAAHLLYAYKLFPNAFDGLKLDIPDGGMPDILTEIRYELEWLLKMQREDGGVYHKVTTMQHAPFIMPEDDTVPLVVFPVSSMAVADFAAVTALASGIYKKFDKSFAEVLYKAAKKSVDWLEAHPEFIGFRNPEGCNTGGYYERDDNSNRYWAYAEMYALTGDTLYKDKISAQMRKNFSLTEFGYGEVGGLGSLAYLLAEHDSSDETADKLKNAFADHAEKLKKLSDKCGYGLALDRMGYHWGSNMVVMKNGMVFAVNYLLNGDEASKEYAANQLHYLMGKNALGISYVSGTGEFRVNELHLRPAFADGIDECIPGMVSGGPNKGLNDPFAQAAIPSDTPPMKCFADLAASYSLNEITIYWNSPAVFVLAFLK
ncbi:glycoside hydrolase family 9 protein [Ruminococcus albus]|uniref:Endoglucanase n=1 Tax=Ruminococcus albus TaxID=1264 RepID=A0A1H7I8Q9_RUMAL|nr:glycoside hydrolase family 9 protein [Ruminococcus albus]SEK58147.1 non-processive endocellulase [Ruminococcus albus]